MPEMTIENRKTSRRFHHTEIFVQPFYFNAAFVKTLINKCDRWELSFFRTQYRTKNGILCTCTKYQAHTTNRNMVSIQQVRCTLNFHTENSLIIHTLITQPNKTTIFEPKSYCDNVHELDVEDSLIECASIYNTKKKFHIISDLLKCLYFHDIFN